MSQPRGEERRVVPFAVPPGRARRRLLEERDGSGAILLFTGVRYERMEPEAPRHAAAAPQTPPRGN